MGSKKWIIQARIYIHKRAAVDSYKSWPKTELLVHIDPWSRILTTVSVRPDLWSFILSSFFHSLIIQRALRFVVEVPLSSDVTAFTRCLKIPSCSLSFSFPHIWDISLKYVLKNLRLCAKLKTKYYTGPESYQLYSIIYLAKRRIISLVEHKNTERASVLWCNTLHRLNWLDLFKCHYISSQLLG